MTACPKCHEELDGELIAQMTEKSIVGFRVVPNEGELLTAETVGGAIANMQKLLSAVSKEVGISTTVLVKSVATDEAGAVDVQLLVMRLAKGVRKSRGAA
ncbi:hypothetical protein [Azospirillum picis]|uniref:Uncharacterized protein n=1 Tax=Azospirillum picis TaxID=488438 RepID=A0ABU0MPI1_9PROT|nr:hypothetical protein [Azospirillum picis]MBP2301548.1 hypothetical protein [Azospirillum picis]MDQ0535380.1 hypothetical protein [Azospirillum picis]